EGEGYPALRRVEGELHRVAGDFGKVDPREDALRRSVLEDRGQAGFANVREFQAFGFTHDPSHGVELMHEAVEQDVAIRPARQPIGVGDSGIDTRLVIVAERLGKRLRQRRTAVQVVVLDVGLDRGLEGRDPQQAEVTESTRLLGQPRAGRSGRHGDVAARADAESVFERPKVMEMHDLRDQAAPDDPYLQPAGHCHPADRCWNAPPTLYESPDGVNSRGRHRARASNSAASGMPCWASTKGSSCSMATVWTR